MSFLSYDSALILNAIWILIALLVFQLNLNTPVDLFVYVFILKRADKI